MQQQDIDDLNAQALQAAFYRLQDVRGAQIIIFDPVAVCEPDATLGLDPDLAPQIGSGAEDLSEDFLGFAMGVDIGVVKAGDSDA